MSSRRVLLASALSLTAALTGCGGGSDAPAPAPAPPAPAPVPAPPPVVLPPLIPDIEVLVSAATPFAANCSGTTNGTEYRNAEVEPHAVVNPLDSNNLVVTWQQDRWSTGGASGVVSAATLDGGVTWTRTAMPFSRCGGGNAGNGGNYGRATDPWLTFSPDRSVYQMALAFDGSLGNATTAMLVARSTDGGRTWGASTPLIVSGSAFFNDKNTITADPTDARYVYAVWDRLVASTAGGPSMLARTTDSGATWEAATVIYNPGPQSQTIGNQVVVLSNGTLINVFTRIDPGANNTQVASIQVIRSTDQGASWSPPIKVADLLAIGARDPATNVPIRDGSIIPEIAVAPNGQVLIVWQDARFSGGTMDGIALARSTDGGLTWSAPAQVNSARTVPAFTPSIRVRPDGTIGIGYYDLRSNTADAATLPTDLMLARSLDGVNWSEVRLTPTFDLITAPQSGGYFLGDYQGLVAAGNVFIPVYVRTTGSTTNRTDVYAVFTRSITAVPLRAQAVTSSAPLPPLAPETLQRASDNIARVMDRRIPGWTRWRAATAPDR